MSEQEENEEYGDYGDYGEEQIDSGSQPAGTGG